MAISCTQPWWSARSPIGFLDPSRERHYSLALIGLDPIHPLQHKAAPVPTLAQLMTADPAQQGAPLLFYACATLTCLSAWAIVFSQNIVRMSVYLLLTLMGAAGFYLMLQAEFLAAVQLIVYAGGTLILIVFGIMLTNKNPEMQLRATPMELGLGALVGVGLAALLILALVHTPTPGQGFTAVPADYQQVRAIGRSLLSENLVPFELAAVLLLVVMVGAAYMARRRAG